VAAAHLLAMTAPQAAGKRFLCYAEHYWFQEIAFILEKHFTGRGYRIPTRSLPGFVVRFYALFDEDARRLASSLGRRTQLSSERLKSTLDWQPRPVEDSIVDTAESLIEFGLVG
jgi:nucleoside-diphosphate-sugar epimerase